MEFSELKNKTAAELAEMLAKLNSELKDLRFRAAGKSLKQGHKIGAVKRDIARIKTHINQK